jgi:tellurite resistance protein TerC
MIVAWLAFIALVLALVALDLGVFHRKAHAVGMREALGWSAVWISLGLAFAVVVFFAYEGRWWGLGEAIDPVDGMVNTGATAVEKYVTGYVIEKSLSIDNIFVIATIFSSLAVPQIHQHRVLFWGVLGALAMRAVMILVGAQLIREFHWILYVFAAFLLVTAVKILVSKPGHANPDASLLVRICRRWLPVTVRYHDQRFFARVRPVELAGPAETDVATGDAGGRTVLALTPLALALVMVEGADLVFAVDSIPAIFAITGDPFLVFTSNVFAMLGLRSLYFALAGLVTQFRHLTTALALVLMVVGGKMLAAEWLKHALGPHFNLYLLAVILTIICGGVVASVLDARQPRFSRKGLRQVCSTSG